MTTPITTDQQITLCERHLSAAIKRHDFTRIATERDTLLALRSDPADRKPLPSPKAGGWCAYCDQRTDYRPRIARAISSIPPLTSRPWDWRLDGGATV